MKLKEVLDKTSTFFREKGFPTARLDTELLLAHGLRMERIGLYLQFDRPLKEEELNQCRELVKRRAQGEPVAYLIGRKDFFGFTFDVGPGVLIPRPETEHLVESALEFAKRKNLVNPMVVDLGCGSGCIGLSILKNLPEARLLAVDLSPEALSFAKANAEKLGVADRVTFLQMDAFDSEAPARALEKSKLSQIDLLLANPPYIARTDARVEANVVKFEPDSALFADDDGLAALKTWTKNWLPSVGLDGFVACEIGSDQGPAMVEWFEKLNLTEVSTLRDLAGLDRVVRGVRHG